MGRRSAWADFQLSAHAKRLAIICSNLILQLCLLTVPCRGRKRGNPSPGQRGSWFPSAQGACGGDFFPSSGATVKLQICDYAVLTRLFLRFDNHSKCDRQQFLPCIECKKLVRVELLGQSDVQHVQAAATDGRRVKRGPLCCRAINWPPVDRLRNQPAALQIALHVGPSGTDLSGAEDAPKNSKGKGVPHLQPMQPGEWQRVGGCVNKALGARAVGIIEVIRDEQTGVRVKA